ncbi:hypothetical protein A5N15_09140 [Rothia kristinae]|uniref:Uncharacterized protein n=1 Tax=Rothia kristinae TaxID=37923 RepID=A0A657IVZ2_9MICC|nr:hypothetical protein A5N15_09140 [Rothia kristinae]
MWALKIPVELVKFSITKHITRNGVVQRCRIGCRATPSREMVLTYSQDSISTPQRCPGMACMMSATTMVTSAAITKDTATLMSRRPR